MNGELYTIYGGTLYKIVDTLGQTEFAENGFSLYPNPARNQFTVKSSNGVFASRIELFDISGKLLLSQNGALSPENTISVSGLAKGLYVVAVETADGKRLNTKLAVD